MTKAFTDYELIVVNDGSTDEFTNKLLENYKKTKTTICTTPNQGLCTTRNYAIERAHGEHICFLDADDILYPEFLENSPYFRMEHVLGIRYCTNGRCHMYLKRISETNKVFHYMV